MNMKSYVQCSSWTEVNKMMAMCRAEGYVFSIDHQSLLLSYWRAQ